MPNSFQYVCACAAGYTGVDCEVDINECSSAPCQHGGACTTIFDAPDAYNCDCTAGYAGDNCNEDINECASTPCAHDGNCTQYVNAYTCQCAPGWLDSDDCTTNIDECASIPCGVHGTCDDGIAFYTCDCEAGWRGYNCDQEIDVCDNIAENDCDPIASCEHTGPGTHICTCPADFETVGGVNRTMVLLGGGTCIDYEHWNTANAEDSSKT
jgi:Notch-like protein